jgi:hypothetical protein
VHPAQHRNNYYDSNSDHSAKGTVPNHWDIRENSIWVVGLDHLSWFSPVDLVKTN